MIKLNVNGIKSVEFTQDTIKVGRNRNIKEDISILKKQDFADIFIKNEKGVSRKHCEIIKKNFQWHIKDLKSTNGTFLNSKKLEQEEEYPLRAKDTISLGNNVCICVEFEKEENSEENTAFEEHKVKDKTSLILEDTLKTYHIEKPQAQKDIRPKTKLIGLESDGDNKIDEETSPPSNPYKTLHNGQYRIVHQLAQAGAFEITYLAEDIHLCNRVVIKEYFPKGCAKRDRTGYVVPLNSTPKIKNDFEWGLNVFKAEAQTIANIRQHKNIVDVKNLFEENGTIYYVMEYNEGEDLEQYLRKNHPLTQTEIESIIFPLFEGVAHIHQYDVLHRDIKLSNIFLTKEGEPILIDFGTAKNRFIEHSENVTTLYTEGYAPIEQHRGEQEEYYTDIYALGMVVYALVNGITNSHELPTAIKRVKNRDNNNRRSLFKFPIKSKRVSKNFIKAIKRTIEIEPKDRPQNIESLIEIFQKSRPSALNSITVSIKSLFGNFNKNNR